MDLLHQRAARRGGERPHRGLPTSRRGAQGHAEADRLRGECDIYVDSKLAEFEEHLNSTLRSVNRGRHQLRTAAGVHDYAQR